MGSGITALASGITSHGTDTIFVGSIRDQNLSSFGIKDQKFGYKNGINNGKTYLVMTMP